ncbi:MAG: PEP-CTERM sorting domain-containing protein [Thermoplasmata archaeon]
MVLGNQGATPEPGSLLLLGSGLLGLGGVLYRQAKRDV